MKKNPLTLYIKLQKNKMPKEKKNEIWIGHNGRGYFLDYTDRYYKFHGKIESYHKQYLQGGNFYKAINTILNIANNFCEKGIKLKFEKNPVIEIPEKEKETIEKLINRLEKDAKENRDLRYSLKIISELSNDKEHLSQYKK